MSFVTRTRTQTRANNNVTTEEPVVSDNILRLWILVGVLGAGKSTFANQIAGQIPNWVRICQDDLGDRRTCEELARASLEDGKHVIIDRQNFSISQRKHFLRIAEEFKVEVSAIVFNTLPDERLQRLAQRTNHPTIETPEQAFGLHRQFTDLYEEVDPAKEPFDHVYQLPADLPLVIDIPYALKLIAEVDRSPRPAAVTPSIGYRGRGGRGSGRARGRGRGYDRGRGRPYNPGAPNNPSSDTHGAFWGSGNMLAGTSTFQATSNPSTDRDASSEEARLARLAAIEARSGAVA